MPAHRDIEVTQVLRRLVRQRLVPANRAGEVIQDLLDLRITRYGHFVLLHRIWQLRNSLSAYDAAYVALAELLGAPLLTCDGRIASAPGHKATVEVV
ncbi:MAG TPA: type II toxin-antitoxin system VapC family toxin [Candidatus Sulfotelmatobacter sp.]|nr:type II toxin-antitoxin system VapC family toxin [Candidatus Sulfotelmatobacter sp.]